MAALTDRAAAMLRTERLPGPSGPGERPVRAVYYDPDCGPQCLFAICRYYGVQTTIAELRQLAHASQSGTSMYALAQAARAKGLDASGVRMPFAAARRVREPVIAVFPNHFYVLMGWHKSAAILLSPPDQALAVPADLMRRIWDERVLIVASRKQLSTPSQPSAEPRHGPPERGPGTATR
jgi:ABC-type bacteriocin/lantibiotic exporter with double-glycine peptidase domain